LSFRRTACLSVVYSPLEFTCVVNAACAPTGRTGDCDVARSPTSLRACESRFHSHSHQTVPKLTNRHHHVDLPRSLLRGGAGGRRTHPGRAVIRSTHPGLEEKDRLMLKCRSPKLERRASDIEHRLASSGRQVARPALPGRRAEKSRKSNHGFPEIPTTTSGSKRAQSQCELEVARKS
jgi:hypothetical protein